MEPKDSSSFQRPFTSLSQINPHIKGAQSRLIPFLLWVGLLAWVARITVFVRQRPQTEFAVIDILAGIQIAIVLFVLLTVLLSARVLPMWSKTAGTSVRMLFIYYFICALSALWSSLPQFSLYRATEFIILFMGLLIALSYSQNFLKAERTMLIVSSIVIIFGMYVNFKLYGLSSSVTSWHTTTYTASAAIMFCYCLGEYFQRERERRKVLTWFALFALGPLILGTSAASNVAALLGVLLVALLYRNKMLIIISGTILFIFVPLSLLVSFEYSLFSSIIFPGKTEEDIYTLHGRI